MIDHAMNGCISLEWMGDHHRFFRHIGKYKTFYNIQYIAENTLKIYLSFDS